MDCCGEWDVLLDTAHQSHKKIGIDAYSNLVLVVHYFDTFSLSL